MTSTQITEPISQEFFPQVSVIIPIYNGEADVPDLLNCLTAQTYPADRVEYLLVDNGSHDRTVALLKAAVPKMTEQGIALRPLSEPQIQSAYAARNVGIKAAIADILVFTDADCRPQPQWLQALVAPLQEPAIGLVAGEVVALLGTSLLEQYADRQDTLSQKHTMGHKFRPYGQTANLAVRRQAFEQAGLFRPYLTTGGDADICWRIQEKGWQIRFAEQATVQHRHRTSIDELRRQWQRYGRSNRYLHELHGVELMREPTAREYVYRVSRWLLKELPVALTKVSTRRAGLVELVTTPLDLLCVQARAAGQKNAHLLHQARQIEWLNSSQPPDKQTE